MRKLEIGEMEMIEGGDFDCGLAIVGFGAAAIGLVTLTAATGGWGVFAAVVGYSAASAGLTHACGGE